MKKLTDKEIFEADIETLHEHGYWVDKQGVATQVINLPTRYLQNCLKFSSGIIRRYIEGELNYRGVSHTVERIKPKKFKPNKKTKITTIGQPCRKCGTPVIKRIPTKRKPEKYDFYYLYYLFCPNCKTMYMVESAKRSYKDNPLS